MTWLTISKPMRRGPWRPRRRGPRRARRSRRRARARARTPRDQSTRVSPESVRVAGGPCVRRPVRWCSPSYPHVGLLGGTQLVVHAVAPCRVERDAVGRVGSQEPRLGVPEQARHGRRVGGVAAEQPVVAQRPQVAGLRAWLPARFLERGLELERLGLVGPLARLQALEEVLDLVLVEAAEATGRGRGPPAGRRGGVRGVLVPVAGDLVEREVEEPRLLDAEVEPDDRDVVIPRRRAATRRWWPPMTTASSRRARTGWTKPHWRRLRVRASSSSSEIRRGLAGSGRSWSMGNCSTVREGRVPLVTTAPPRRLRARRTAQRAPRSG